MDAAVSLSVALATDVVFCFTEALAAVAFLLLFDAFAFGLVAAVDFFAAFSTGALLTCFVRPEACAADFVAAVAGVAIAFSALALESAFSASRKIPTQSSIATSMPIRIASNRAGQKE
ncbi:MAG: hypothetical protein ACU0C9_00965 [Paracoccaceae bacterium]